MDFLPQVKKSLTVCKVARNLQYNPHYDIVEVTFFSSETSFIRLSVKSLDLGVLVGEGDLRSGVASPGNISVTFGLGGFELAGFL
jgi:hypothetical protein